VPKPSVTAADEDIDTASSKGDSYRPRSTVAAEICPGGLAGLPGVAIPILVVERVAVRINHKYIKAPPSPGNGRGGEIGPWAAAGTQPAGPLT